MKRSLNIRRGGFTLVEMLVVIAIIGILAAILVPTLGRVTRRARETRIATEMSQIVMQIEAYKQKYGDYPPDFSDLTVVTRHLRKAFPRHAEATFTNTTMTLPNGQLPTYDHDANPSTAPIAADTANLDPSEALVFWLGMIRNNDSRYPLNGPGEPDKSFDFDQTRLNDPDGDGWPSYYPQSGKEAPYIYFDSRTYGLASYTNSGTSETVYPYRYQKPSDATPNPNAVTWAAEAKFQLISAGLDGEYGESLPAATAFPALKLPPPPPSYDITGHLDNITNFSEGKPLRDNPDYNR